MSGRCKLTVLKCLFDEELKAEYIDDPDYGPCPYFSPGDVLWSSGEKPENFSCRVGWKSFEQEVRNMSEGGGFDVHILCCNDGIRPVIFRVEREGYEHRF